MAAHFRASTLLLSLTLAHAYPNGAPNARLPTLGWSSWIALGPAGSPPVFDFCDEASVKASADAFIALGLYDAGYRHFHLDDCVRLRAPLRAPQRFLLGGRPSPHAGHTHTHIHTRARSGRARSATPRATWCPRRTTSPTA